MDKRRSKSIEESCTQSKDLTMTAFELQILDSVRENKRLNKKRNGLVMVKQKSWLRLCCFMNTCVWKQKYLIVAQDRVFVGNHSADLTGIQLLLDSLCIEVAHHESKIYCLKLNDGKKKITISLRSKEEMEFWISKFKK